MLSTLDMALWKDSSTSKNLRQAGKVTLMISDRGVNYYLKGSVRELHYEMPGAAPVSRFRVDFGASHRGSRAQRRDHHGIDLSAYDQARLQ